MPTYFGNDLGTSAVHFVALATLAQKTQLLSQDGYDVSDRLAPKLRSIELVPSKSTVFGPWVDRIRRAICRSGDSFGFSAISLQSGASF